MEGIVSSEFPVQPKVRETTVSFFLNVFFLMKRMKVIYVG